MSLIGNVSSQIVGNNLVNSSNKLFNPSSNRSAIVLFAVAMIIALGIVLLKRCCPGLQFSAQAATPPHQPNVQSQQEGGLGFTGPLSTTHTSPITMISTDPVSVPDGIFSLGEQRGATHYQRHITEDGTPDGWFIIYDYKDGSLFYPDNKTLVRRIDRHTLDQANWISAEEVRRCKRPNMNFDTDPSHVSDYAFELGQTGELTSVTTHYRDFQDEEGNHRGWLLINDNEKIAYKVPFNKYFPEKRSQCSQWAFPTDQTGWISAEEVRRYKQPSEPQQLPNSDLSSQHEGSALPLIELETFPQVAINDLSSSPEAEASDHSTDAPETGDEQHHSEVETELEQPIDLIETSVPNPNPEAEASDHSTDAPETGDGQPDPELELSGDLDPHSSSNGVDAESHPEKGAGNGEEPTTTSTSSTTEAQTPSMIDGASNSNLTLAESTIAEATSSTQSTTQPPTRRARNRPMSSLAGRRSHKSKYSKFNTIKYSKAPAFVGNRQSEEPIVEPSTSTEQPIPEVVPASQPPRRFGNTGGPQLGNLFGAGGVSAALAGLRSTKKTS